MVAAAHAAGAGVQQAPVQVAAEEKHRNGKRESHDTIIHFMLE